MDEETKAFIWFITRFMAIGAIAFAVWWYVVPEGCHHAGRLPSMTVTLDDDAKVEIQGRVVLECEGKYYIYD